MDKQSSRISVVMSVYNAEKYLREALDSILNQVFTDFEFIIIDDGSTDRTTEILDSYTDPQIIRLKNEKNIGLAAALNKGIAIARGEYIARMDADDVSLPKRFDQQIQYLTNHPNIGIVGTWVKRIDEDGNEIELFKPPTSADLIKWSLLFDNCLYHSSVMIRRTVLEQIGNYCSTSLFAQDYELWLRASCDVEIVNLGEILHSGRESEGQVSVQHRQQQDEFALKAQQAVFNRILGREIDDLIYFRRAMSGFPLKDQRLVLRVAQIILELYKAFLREKSLDPITRGEIARHAAGKLLFLASKNIDTAFWSSIYVFFQAKGFIRTCPNCRH